MFDKSNAVFVSKPVKGSVYVHPCASEALIDPERIVILGNPYVEDPVFSRLTANHGRSHLDKIGVSVKTHNIVDEHGNKYGEFNLKGVDFSLPKPSLYDIEPSGVRVNGVMDAKTFPRVIEASAVMRAAGMFVEWPVYTARPKYFPGGSGGSGRDLLELKSDIFFDYATEQRGKSAEPRVQDVYDLGVGLLNMEFGVCYRAMKSNVRISDLSLLDRKERNKAIDNAIRTIGSLGISWINRHSEMTIVDPGEEDGRNIFLQSVVPKIMGWNLAKMRTLKNAEGKVTPLYHKYLHPGNWTICGEIVDLDSVQGLYEYDVDVGIDHHWEDLLHALFSTNNLTDGLSEDSRREAKRVLLRSYRRELRVENAMTQCEDDVLSLTLFNQYPSQSVAREADIFLNNSDPFCKNILSIVDDKMRDNEDPDMHAMRDICYELSQDELLVSLVSDVISRKFTSEDFKLNSVFAGIGNLASSEIFRVLVAKYYDPHWRQKESWDRIFGKS
jgi:hypothetical protein